MDPSGLYYTFLDLDHEDAEKDSLNWAWIDDDGDVTVIEHYKDIDAWSNAPVKERFKRKYGARSVTGYELAECLVNGETIDEVKHDTNWLYERLQFLSYSGATSVISSIEKYMKQNNLTVNIKLNTGKPKQLFGGYNGYTFVPNRSINIYWNPTWSAGNRGIPEFPPLVGLVHELSHAADFVYKDPGRVSWNTEVMAFAAENQARNVFKVKVPGWEDIELHY